VSQPNEIANDVSYVLKQVKDQDIRFLRLWFTDILGYLKSISITSEGLEDVLCDGMSFDGSSIEGLARNDESDLVAIPDASTLALLPWRPSTKRVARVFSDLHTPEGISHEADPRAILRGQLERAQALGYTFYASAELEFFLLDRSGAGAQPVDRAGYFDQDITERTTDVRRQIILTLEEMGIAVHSSHHEGAPGQHEIVLQYADALTMADAIQTARFVTKEMARRNDMYATFMPRPIAEVNGSGMHLGLSLYKEGENAFYDEKDSLCLSGTARNFLAGLLERARESTLVVNQWVNSYRRLVPGTEAPVYVSWAQTNRSDLIRVPASQKGRSHSTRIEYRSPDAACNPYLVLAVLLAAGLDGVEAETKPPEPVTENVFEMSNAQRKEAGIKRLPEDMGEAIARAERSTFLKETLGTVAWEVFLANKRMEWQAYCSTVTDWEIERYLSVL
jgi:glutamine synthetase